MEVIFLQPLKAPTPTVVIFSEMVIVVNPVLYANALSPISVKLGNALNVESAVPMKAELPKRVIVCGMVIDVSPVLRKALSPISVSMTKYCNSAKVLIGLSVNTSPSDVTAAASS